MHGRATFWRNASSGRRRHSLIAEDVKAEVTARGFVLPTGRQLPTFVRANLRRAREHAAEHDWTEVSEDFRAIVTQMRGMEGYERDVESIRRYSEKVDDLARTMQGLFPALSSWL